QKDQSKNMDDFLTFFNTIEDLLIVLDLNGNILHFNPEVPRCLSYTTKEISKMNVVDIYSAELKQEVEATLENILEGKMVVSSIPLQAKDGHLIPVETKFFAGRWSGEDAVYGVSRDVTTHREIEKALREREEQLELALLSSNLGIFDWNILTGEMRRNERWAEIFGFTIEEVRPTLDFWEKLIHPDDLQQVKQIMDDFLGEKTTFWEAEYRAWKKSGELLWIRDHGKIVEWDKENRPLRATGTLLDITKRKQTEEALRESEELFRATFEATAGGILIVSSTGVIIHGNPQFAEMFRISDELMRAQDGQKILDRILDQIQNPDEFYTATLELRKSSRESYDVLMFKDGRVFERFGAPLIMNGELKGRVYSFRDVTERVHAEEALSESEKRYRLLADNVTDVLWIVDMNLRFTYVSPSVKQVFGYTVEEAMSMSLEELLTRDSFEIIMTELAEALTMDNSDTSDFGESTTIEVEMFHQDGSRMWAEFSRSFVRDDDGILSGALGVARDITSRKRAKEAQERERKAFYIIAEAAVRATTVSDLCHRVLDEVAEVLEFDVGAVRLYDEQEHLLELVAVVGMSEEEVKKKAIAQTLDDSRTVVPIVTHTRKDIFSIDVTTQDTHEDPKLMPDELEARLVISWPIQGANQDLLGVMILMAYTPREISEKDRTFFETVAGMFSTVLERRRAEENLRESEERFVLFADHIPGPLYIKDHETRVLFANKFMRVIAGDDSVGKTTLELAPSEVAELMTAEEQKVITDGPIEIIERRQGENGTIQIFQSLKFPIFRTGKPPLIGGFSLDITRQKTAEEQLERAVARAKLLNDLMVHDLNNMHQGIMSNLELILLDSDLASSLKRFAESALTQTQRSVALVGNVRKFSSVDREEIELTKTDPYMLLVDAVEMVKNSFPKKVISLNTNITEESHPVFANEFLVDVFYNLIHNSLTVDPSNDVILDIDASPSEEPGFTKFEFADRGPGISDETKETVLSRLEGREQLGWGLGLTLVKRIIDRYGGKIWIKDRVEGDYKQGACFVILLVDASNPSNQIHSTE
ncbi:MAG: PAS domain S-box protein, partial [Candidatus Thorarchaeota archaeon]|nr:PAS domain S-box protein [Candidatus Thorarchaeota archaeon]